MKKVAFGWVASVLLCLAGCGGGDTPTGAGNEGGSGSELTGTVLIDGSSTVYPISEAAAEGFRERAPKVKVTVGVSGTGGGFKRFGGGEIDLAGASRPIKDMELKDCQAHGVDFIELPVAYDGIAIVVNPANTWCESLTVAELKLLWSPEAQNQIMKWNQIRPQWPDQPVTLFGAGADSGTYDYFTHAVVGKEHSSRGDYTATEDDNVSVQGVATDKNALGFFGLAYFEENRDKLKLVAVDDGNPANGDGPVLPSNETVRSGAYQPLSRPLFIYVSRKAAERVEVAAFVDYYLETAATYAGEVGFVPCPDSLMATIRNRWNGRVTGSVLGGSGSREHVDLEALLK